MRVMPLSAPVDLSPDPGLLAAAGAAGTLALGTAASAGFWWALCSAASRLLALLW